MKSTESMKLLDGYWNYIPDAGSRLIYEQADNSLHKKKTKKIKIPSNWERAGIHNFSGSIWFSRSFRFSSETPTIKILEFKGADYFADVWLNDTYLGGHEGYFQSFYFDVTGLLKKRGDNKIIVKVTSPFEEPGKVWPHRKKLIKGIFNHHDCRPGAWSYQHGQDQNTGGIWNSVIIHAIENVFVDSVRVTPKINFKSKKTSLGIVISYYRNSNTPARDKVELKIKSPSGKVLTSRHDIRINGVKGELKINTEIVNPELWWSWDLGKPNLYKLNIAGGLINIEKIRFGIRNVKLNKNKEFFLNGKRLFLRGTNIIPTQFLSELSGERISGQVSMMKEANINIVRMHAHVNRTEYYEECDRQGLLVWQDFALQWTYDQSRKFINNTVSQIKDMVRLLYNHPSIAFWCCHNEPGDQINTLDGFLYDAVTGIDKSRIVRKASNYEEHPYDGWYWGNKEHFAVRPMGPLVTEFGAQALPELKSLKKIIPPKDINNPAKESWAYHDFQYEQTFNIAEVNRGRNIKEFINNSQEYQSILIKTAVDFYRRGKNKDITGIFQFMFIDCWPSITWSVVDYYGKKKKGYHTLQEAFQPVYVSLNILQKKYFTGKQINLEIWVINDLHISYKNCVLAFKIDKRPFFKLRIGRIIKDSVVHFKRESINIKLPETLRAGKYLINAELTDQRGILATNKFEIEIVRKV